MSLKSKIIIKVIVLIAAIALINYCTELLRPTVESVDTQAAIAQMETANNYILLHATALRLWLVSITTIKIIISILFCANIVYDIYKNK